MNLMDKCNKIISQNKNTSSIPALPQITNLDQRVSTFLGNAKRFLEKTYQLLCLFYGADNQDASFKKYREWMVKHKSKNKDIIRLLQENEDWINQLARMRNALDINHAKDNYKVIVENFKLRPGNNFTNPCWRYDFSGKKGKVQDNPSDIITDMDVFMHNMLTFFEELFLQCIKDNWNASYNFEIYRFTNENINEKCPQLYYISKQE